MKTELPQKPNQRNARFVLFFVVVVFFQSLDMFFYLVKILQKQNTNIVTSRLTK